MYVTLLVTVLFWGDAKPLEITLLTDSSQCSHELVKRYTKPLRVLEGWKAIKSECIE